MEKLVSFIWKLTNEFPFWIALSQRMSSEATWDEIEAGIPASSILTVPIPQTDWKPAPKYSQSQQLISSGSKDFVPASELRALDTLCSQSAGRSRRISAYEYVRRRRPCLFVDVRRYYRYRTSAGSSWKWIPEPTWSDVLYTIRENEMRRFLASSSLRCNYWRQSWMTMWHLTWLLVAQPDRNLSAIITLL